jgi:regulator of sigma E protease
VLSVGLGLFNLLPVPMLDGGQLAMYAIEAVRGKPLSLRVQEYGLRLGFALVICMVLFVSFNDIRLLLR